MDMFRVASIEKVSVVRAMVQLAAPPGAGRSPETSSRRPSGSTSTGVGAWRCWGTWGSRRRLVFARLMTASTPKRANADRERRR